VACAGEDSGIFQREFQQVALGHARLRLGIAAGRVIVRREQGKRQHGQNNHDRVDNARRHHPPNLRNQRGLAIPESSGGVVCARRRPDFACTIFGAGYTEPVCEMAFFLDMENPQVNAVQ
jgi:hypothetical protein